MICSRVVGENGITSLMSRPSELEVSYSSAIADNSSESAAAMPVDADIVPQTQPSAVPVASSFHHLDILQPRNPSAAAHPSRLFTASELAVLPADQMFDRQKLKQQAKKAKKRAAIAAKTEDDLVFGFDFMGVSHEDDGDEIEVETVKAKRTKKEKAKPKPAPKPAAEVMAIDEEAKKESDFAAFLQSVGGAFLQAVT